LRTKYHYNKLNFNNFKERLWFFSGH